MSFAKRANISIANFPLVEKFYIRDAIVSKPDKKFYSRTNLKNQYVFPREIRVNISFFLSQKPIISALNGKISVFGESPFWFIFPLIDGNGNGNGKNFFNYEV